jgi:hypothetical protein
VGVEGGPQPNLKSRPGVSLSPTYGLDAGERDRLHNDHFLLAGGMLALLHAVFAVILKANQVLSGLALTLLGMGLTSFMGRSLVGVRPCVHL